MSASPGTPVYIRNSLNVARDRRSFNHRTVTHIAVIRAVTVDLAPLCKAPSVSSRLIVESDHGDIRVCPKCASRFRSLTGMEPPPKF